jgi:phosphoglycerate kinase
MNNPLPTLEQLDVDNRRVFLRVDFNVPLDDGQITDDTRIRAALPTIAWLRQRGCRVILASHLGRPKGAEQALSLEPTAARLAELINGEVTFAHDIVGEDVELMSRELVPGGVMMLENLRFHIEEEGKCETETGEKVKADPEKVKAFRASLRKHADIFVSDAFGTAHRAHRF